MKKRNFTADDYEPVKHFSKSSFCNAAACIEIGVWKKSTASATNGECVETTGLLQSDGSLLIGVRDSKQKGKGPVLRYNRAEWNAFIAGVKAGEFDLPD